MFQLVHPTPGTYIFVIGMLLSPAAAGASAVFALTALFKAWWTPLAIWGTALFWTLADPPLLLCVLALGPLFGIAAYLFRSRGCSPGERALAPGARTFAWKSAGVSIGLALLGLVMMMIGYMIGAGF